MHAIPKVLGYVLGLSALGIAYLVFAEWAVEDASVEVEYLASLNAVAQAGRCTLYRYTYADEVVYIAQGDEGYACSFMQ